MKTILKQFEDAYESPVWMEYKLVLTANNKRQAIQIREKKKAFESTHPQLTLIHAEYGTQEISVYNPNPVFRDHNKMYYALKYSFIRRYYTYYYQPDPEFHNFLNYLQELINKMKKIRQQRIKPKYSLNEKR